MNCEFKDCSALSGIVLRLQAHFTFMRRKGKKAANLCPPGSLSCVTDFSWHARWFQTRTPSSSTHRFPPPLHPPCFHREPPCCCRSRDPFARQEVSASVGAASCWGGLALLALCGPWSADACLLCKLHKAPPAASLPSVPFSTTSRKHSGAASEKDHWCDIMPAARYVK